MNRRSLYKIFFAVTVLASIATAMGFAAAASSRSAASLDQRPPKLQVALDQVVAAGAGTALPPTEGRSARRFPNRRVRSDRLQ